MIYHVWRFCKDLTFAHLLFTATCSRMNSPFNQSIQSIILVSFPILLRPLRVYILKQLFTSGSVNIMLNNQLDFVLGIIQQY